MVSRFSFLRIIQLKRSHILSSMDGLEDAVYDYLQMLYHIENNPDCTQKDISVAFGISKALVTRNIQFMEKRGLIKRTVNKDDERSYRLQVTEKGKELFSACEDTVEKVEHLQFSGFSTEEREQFEGYLARIMDNLETDVTGSQTIAQLNGKLARRGGRK